MSKDAVYLSRDGAVATIHLNRPDKRNALNAEMWTQLIACVEAAENDRAVKVVIVTGQGGVFAAGQDIEELGKGLEDRAWLDGAAELIYQSQKRLHLCAKPTIAKVRGACVGGGNGIALCCDLRFADPSAKFGITPAKLGVIYPALDTKRLVDAVGPSRAKDILFTGRIVSAEEALDYGMIDWLVAPEALDKAVADYAAQICEASQYAARGMKRVVQQIVDGLSEETKETRAVFTGSFLAEDFKEGRAAFLGKRKPKFTFS